MTLTEKGSLLRRIYSEHDLELCEALLAGTFDKLDANGLAAVLSSLVYEARRGGDGEPRHYPGGISGPIAIASSKLKGICEDIDILCEDHGLDEMQRPDFGILDIMYEWADGGSLGSCLYGTDMTGGDFVRTAKRLADVLQQIPAAAVRRGRAAGRPRPRSGRPGQSWRGGLLRRGLTGGRLMGVCQPTSEAGIAAKSELLRKLVGLKIFQGGCRYGRT